jgi:hypothetical protein
MSMLRPSTGWFVIHALILSIFMSHYEAIVFNYDNNIRSTALYRFVRLEVAVKTLKAVTKSAVAVKI